MSRSMTSSDGFLGNRVEVLPAPSSFLSVVMLSSSNLDDASGFPFRLPFGPFLGGLQSGLTFPPPWNLGSSRSTSSSTTNTFPGMRPLERLAPEGTVPSPRRLPRRANTFCSEAQGNGWVSSREGLQITQWFISICFSERKCLCNYLDWIQMLAWRTIITTSWTLTVTNKKQNKMNTGIQQHRATLPSLDQSQFLLNYIFCSHCKSA